MFAGAKGKDATSDMGKQQGDALLHGYNQPTLLIHYELLTVWAGRIDVRKGTCRLEVVTLYVKEKLAGLIWSREVLHYEFVEQFLSQSRNSGICCQTGHETRT